MSKTRSRYEKALADRVAGRGNDREIQLLAHQLQREGQMSDAQMRYDMALAGKAAGHDTNREIRLWGGIASQGSDMGDGRVRYDSALAGRAAGQENHLKLHVTGAALAEWSGGRRGVAPGDDDSHDDDDGPDARSTRSRARPLPPWHHPSVIDRDPPESDEELLERVMGNVVSRIRRAWGWRNQKPKYTNPPWWQFWKGPEVIPMGVAEYNFFKPEFAEQLQNELQGWYVEDLRGDRRKLAMVGQAAKQLPIVQTLDAETAAIVEEIIARTCGV